MTALNSKGLEKARDAFYGGPGKHFENPPFDALEAAISAYLSALPPVDGLEVVGHLTEEGGATKIGFHPISSRSEGLVTLSQASSVIAGLRAERITAERDALDAYGKLQTAEARISSLEEENKRLREALEPFAEVAEKDIGGSEHENDLFQPMQQHNRAPRLTVGHLRAARQALEYHNG